jgi:hypothetical protein
MKQRVTYSPLTSTTPTSTMGPVKMTSSHASPAPASLLSVYTPSSPGITPSCYGQPKYQGSKHHHLAIGDPKDSGSQRGKDVVDSP